MAKPRGTGDWLVLEEKLERGDPSFVDDLRSFHDAEVLAGFATRWFADKRPASRRLLLEYLDRPLNAFRHEGLVKRPFKTAEAAGDEGFAVNEAKSRVLRRNAAQVVTGLVVNSRPGVARAEVRRLRAILHRARTEGLERQNREGRRDFVAWLRGKIAFVAMARPEAGERLRRNLEWTLGRSKLDSCLSGFEHELTKETKGRYFNDIGDSWYNHKSTNCSRGESSANV